MTHHRSFDLTTAVSAADRALGPPDATVTLVEYADFECPYCKQAAMAVKAFLARFGWRRIRYVFRHFPLEEVHPHARRAAEAAECAGAQGKFWEMHQLLFDNQLKLEERQLQSYAERLQLDLPRYLYEMRQDIHLRKIREHQRSGRASGVRAMPGFFINGRLHDVSHGLLSLSDGIEDELHRRNCL